MLLILYPLTIIIILYHNYFTMRGVTEQSMVARRPSFFLIYLFCAYGILAVFWYIYGWKLALLALVFSWTVDKFSFRYFFDNAAGQR